MAIIDQGILGGVRKKVGGVVGSTWKGIKTIRGYQPSVANPRTTAQVNQRAKFAGASKAGSQVLATICKPLWDRFAVKESGFNAFVKNNIEGFSTEGRVSAPEEIVAAKGRLDLVVIETVSSVDQQVTVTWDATASNQFTSPSDKVYVMVCGDINATEPQFSGFATNALRSAGTVTVTLPDFNETTNDMYAWIAFQRVDNSMVGDGGGAITQ